MPQRSHICKYATHLHACPYGCVGVISACHRWSRGQSCKFGKFCHNKHCTPGLNVFDQKIVGPTEQSRPQASKGGPQQPGPSGQPKGPPPSTSAARSAETLPNVPPQQMSSSDALGLLGLQGPVNQLTPADVQLAFRQAIRDKHPDHAGHKHTQEAIYIIAARDILLRK